MVGNFTRSMTELKLWRSLHDIIKEEGNAALRDFSNVEEVVQNIRAVIITLAATYDQMKWNKP
jgi:hypothetical protein